MFLLYPMFNGSCIFLIKRIKNLPWMKNQLWIKWKWNKSKMSVFLLCWHSVKLFLVDCILTQKELFLFPLVFGFWINELKNSSYRTSHTSKEELQTRYNFPPKLSQNTNHNVETLFETQDSIFSPASEAVRVSRRRTFQTSGSDAGSVLGEYQPGNMEHV